MTGGQDLRPTNLDTFPAIKGRERFVSAKISFQTSILEITQEVNFSFK